MSSYFLKLSVFVVVFSFFSTKLYSQKDTIRASYSPYTVINNHLYYLQASSYHPELAAQSFYTDPETGKTLAILLKQILDGKGMYIDLNRLPDQHGYKDSLSGESIYFINRHEPLIYVEQIDSAWYYSRTTVEAIPRLHKQIYPLGTQLAVWFQAPTWQFSLLGIPLWKWLGFAVLLLLSLALYRVTNWLFGRTIAPALLRRLDLAADVNQSLQKLSRQSSLWVALFFLRYALPMLQLPAHTNALLVKAMYILGVFFLIFIMNQLIRLLFFKLRRISENTSNTLDDQFMPILRRLAFFVTWVLGIFYVLDSLDVNVTALLAGISIGGLAVALAAQDTVKNFFGSIMIFVDKPFQIGDAIAFKDVSGVVEEVGVRSTRIRTFSNSLTSVPNGILADQIVDNLGLRVYRRYKTEIGITYDTPPALIDLFVEGVRAILQRHPSTRKDFIEVHLNEFGASALNLLVYTFFEVPDYTTELKSRHELMYAMIMLADDLGVRFAFPTQTLHIETFPDPDVTDPGPKSVREAKAALAKSLEKTDTYFR